MKTTHKLVTLLLGITLLAASLPVEALLKAKDQAKLGKLVGAYYESLADRKGIAKAKAELNEALQKHNKKLTKKAKQQVDLLASGADMSAVFASSKTYPKRAAVGKVVDFTYDIRGMSVEYALHAPKKYKSSKGAVPLILIIPDEGEAPDRLLDDAWMLGDVRNGAVLAALVMPEDTELWGRSGAGSRGGVETLMFAMRNIRANYAIDPDQIYIAGHGAGVTAAMQIANVFPHVFAGVIGRSGDLDGQPAANFGNLKTFFTGAGAGVTAFEQEALGLGYESVRVDPGGGLEEVWEWVEATAREGNPATVSFAPSTMQGACYWLSASGYDLDLDEKPSITAQIDREKNVIVVTSKGISQVLLLLNDSLVDLDRELSVICNGVEHRDTFDRSLSMALKQFYNSNDSGRIYTAYKTYDLLEGQGD